MLLHAHHSADISVVSFLSEVILDGFIDTIKIIPFLFLTYLLMEYIEHKASEKSLNFMQRSGKLGPLVGGALGAVPQCAFSAVASNLFTARIISVGTLVAVFLSTSDEMLAILIAGNANVGNILLILGYKAMVGILMGFLIDIFVKLFFKKKTEIDIDRICENDNCHCEKGILYSSIHHTVTISLFIFAVTLVINSLIFFIGTDRLSELGASSFGLSHLIFAVIGLVPGCATSVAISTLGLKGIISAGSMLAGLFPNAGVGLIILWRLNQDKKENIFIMLTIVTIGTVFGMLADVIGLTV